MSNPQLPTPNTAFSFSQHPPSNNVSLLFSDTFRRRRRVLVIWTRREDGRTRRPKDDESVGDDKKFVTILLNLFFFGACVRVCTRYIYVLFVRLCVRCIGFRGAFSRPHPPTHRNG